MQFYHNFIFATLLVFLALTLFVVRSERVEVSPSGSSTANNNNKTTSKPTVATLQAFSDAWNRHDIQGLMSFMSQRKEVQFHAVAGESMMGTSYIGYEEIKRGFRLTFETFPDAQWLYPIHFMSEDGKQGVTESTFVGSKVNSDGTRTRFEARMVDILTFDSDGKIFVKNAYRKNVPGKAMTLTE